MIKIVIVDDMEEIRNYLCEVLSKEEEKIKVVGMASSGLEAIELVKKTEPDVVLMDIQMEDRMAGINAIEKICHSNPKIKCIVLTIHENDEYLFRAYMVGASDYIIKMMPPEKIVKSIYDVMDNELLLRPEAARKIINEYQRIHSNQTLLRDALQVMMMISTTEYEILRLAYYGYTYRNIAQMRYVQDTTIRSQINHILKKFKKKRMKDVIEMLRGLRIFEDE